MRELVSRLEQEWRSERQAMNGKLEALKTNLATKEIEALKATVIALQGNSRPINKQKKDERSVGNQKDAKLPIIREEGSSEAGVGEATIQRPSAPAIRPASYIPSEQGKTKTLPSFKAPLPAPVEKEVSASVKRGRKAKADEGVEVSKDSVIKPDPKLERAPSQYRSRPVAQLTNAPAQMPIPDVAPRKDAAAVASHVAKLLNSPKKKAAEPKTRVPKQPAANPPLPSLAEQSKPVQGTAAFIPRLAKRVLENENSVPNNRSISATTTAKIHAAPPSTTLGISGISFNSIARKKIKLPSRDAANADASAPPIQTRTRANISELTGTNVNAIPELMAAFNVSIPPRKK